MSNKKYHIEFFQGMGSANNAGGGTDLSSAYKKGASVKNLISDTGSGATDEGNDTASNASASNSANTETVIVEESGPQGSGIGSLWNFLGVDNLTLKQKQCVYNCGIDVFGCLERCANPDCRKQEKLSKEQCRFGCMRKGINCTTTCISEIEAEPQSVPMFLSDEVPEPTLSLPITESAQTTGVALNTTASINCPSQYDIEPTEVHGVYQNLDSYAPFDMRVWPQQGKYGWTINELNHMRRNGYDSPDVIEVNMNHSLYPIKTDMPLMEFEYASS